MIAILPSASATKGRKKSAVEKKEIVVAHMANKRQIPEKEKIECKHGISMSLYNTHYYHYHLKYILRYIGIIVQNKHKTYFSISYYYIILFSIQDTVLGLHFFFDGIYRIIRRLQYF